MKAKTLFTAFFIALSSLLFGQSQSTLHGVVTDKAGEAIIGGNITVYKDKVKKLSAVTDVDGKYSINIDAGTYDVEFSYLGLKTSTIKGVLFAPGQIVSLDVTLEDQSFFIPSCFLSRYNLRQDMTSSGFKLRAEEIKHLPTRDIGTMINMNQNILWNW
jgi:hypothetical protein